MRAAGADRRLLATWILGPYLSRIGLPASTPRPPTLETLRTLALHHVTHVPFENVDVQLGVPLRLDRESLERKLVTARRGGYCFEQNWAGSRPCWRRSATT